MKGILNFISGNVDVEIRGGYPERFLNLCARSGVAFWAMERVAPDTITVRMGIKNYRRLRPLAKRSMCRIHIIKKTGVPFFTYKFRKRYFLMAGLFLFIISAWILTSFVWIIDISGCKEVNPALLRKNLKDCGVYIGAYSQSIDIETLKNDMLLKMPDLSFITVNLKGSHAEVIVRERIKPPKIVSLNEPCNIIATKGGIITSVVAQNGTAEVKPGDTVVEGQLLISTYMTQKYTTPISVHAMGEVKARTWRTVTSKMNLKTNAKTYTGRHKDRYSLIIGGKIIKLFLGGISYEKYDKIIKRSDLTLPGGIVLPVGLETEINNEYKTKPFNIPPETAFEFMASSLENNIGLDPEKGKILKFTPVAQLGKDTAIVTMTAECEEIISEESILPKGE